MEILSGIVQFLLVTVVFFAVLCILASFLRFQNLAEKAARTDTEGMDPHDAFHVRIANLLGTAHRSPEPFFVMLIRCDSLPSIVQQYGEAMREEVLLGLEERIRSGLRKGDTVSRCEGDRIGAIVNASCDRAPLVAQRIVEQLQTEPCRCKSGLVLRVTASAGLASHPENGDRVRDLMDAATRSLELAEAGSAERVILAPQTPAPAAATEPPRVPDQSGLVDPLTGVLKPDRVPNALQKYAAKFRKRGLPVAVMIMDIDHFDRYGEHYGSSAGDEILKGLSKVLQDNVREDDLLARFGQTEFIAAMGCPARDALLAGQRLAGLVRRTVIPVGHSSLKITICAGIAGSPEHGGTPRQLLEAADAALDVAKGRGRSVCLLYDHSMRLPDRKAQAMDVF